MAAVPKGTTGYLNVTKNTKSGATTPRSIVLVQLFDVRRPNAYPNKSGYFFPLTMLQRGTKKLDQFTIDDPSSQLILRPQLATSGSIPDGMDNPLARFLQALVLSFYNNSKQDNGLSNKELLLDAGVAEHTMDFLVKFGPWPVIKPMLQGKRNSQTMRYDPLHSC